MSNSRKLIGLVGTKQVGKSTIGKYLQQKYQFRDLSFSAPLKRLCSEAFHIPPHHFEMPVTKELTNVELGVSPRQIMQTVGTGLFRNELSRLLPELTFGEDCGSIWIYSLKKDLENDRKSNIVITDVRFEDELKFVQTQGGKLMYIDRFDKDQWCRDAHESERAFYLKNQCDVVIDNTGNLDDTLEQVDSFLNQM